MHFRLKGVNRYIWITFVRMTNVWCYCLSYFQILPKNRSSLVFSVHQSLFDHPEVVWSQSRNIEDETSLGLILSIKPLFRNLLLIMMNKRLRTESSNKFIGRCFDNSHTIVDSVTSIVETFRREVVLTSTVYKFGRTNHEISWVKETIYFDKLLMICHFRWLG